MNVIKDLTASAFALTIGVSACSAATLNVNSNQLFGATGVDVDGTSYDVSFVDGTCVTVFDGCDDISDFTFSTEANALLASQALLDQVLIDGPLGQFGSVPNAINGISDVNNAQILTIFGFNPFSPANPASASARISTGPGGGTTTNFSFVPQSDLSSSAAFVWAVWNESPVVVDPDPMAPVPLPAGGLLLLTGLAGIAGFQRRKKHTA